MASSLAGSSVTSLIESARRRLQIQILSSQFLLALSIGAGGLVLLLILGTQVLDWYWPLVLFVVSIGVLLYRVWSKLPSAYSAAQLVDQRLRSFDLFSSAYYFLGQPRTPVSTALIETADASAATVEASTAIPFRMPSGWARAGVLSIAALSLLVFRYAFQSSLDLERPIAPGLFQLLASGEKPTQYAKGNAKDPMAPPLEGIGMTQNAQQRGDEKSIEKGQELDTQSTAGNETSATGQKPGQFQQTMSPSDEGEKAQGSEKGDTSTAGDKGQQGNEAGKEGEKKEGGQPDKKGGAQKGDQKGEKNSLMDKFRDAMANMMNKMKPEDKNQGQKQEQNGKQENQQGNGQQQQAQKGQQAEGKQQNGQQQQQADPNGQQQGEGNEKSPNQQAKGGDKSNQPSSGDAKAGMGKQDGAKNIELAEQQKAMGKISEVFGKRAQNLQGEMMIEVSSSKSQALKTNYSGKTAGHTDSSGVIHRDEVPLEFQNYVQRYFEELRKSPVPVAKPGKQ